MKICITNLNQCFSEEIIEVKSELENEGLTPDEATELIKNVFKKVNTPTKKTDSMKTNSIESNGDDLEINHRPQKTWKEALLLMSDLMQVQNSVKMKGGKIFFTFFLFR